MNYLPLSLIADIAIYLGAAIGLWVSFRVMRYPDLSIESLFVLGGVVFASLAETKHLLLLLPICLLASSSLIGFVASILRNKFQIHPIIVSLAAGYFFYSLSLLILGGPNRYFGNTLPRPGVFYTTIVAFVFFFIVTAAMDLGARTRFGLRILACGSNPKLATRQGLSPTLWQGVALSLSFLLVMSSGAFFAWRTGNIDVSHGSGLLLISIFVVVFARALQERVKLFKNTVFLALCLAVYLVILQLALRMGMPPQWLRGASAVALLMLVIALPKKKVQLLF